MKDLVFAVYEVENYAGETTLRLVDVFVNVKDIPEKYETYNYVIKGMQLQEYNGQ